MAFHGIDDNIAFLVFPADVRADLDMGSFHFMVDGFSDIMQKTCALSQPDIASAFSGQKTGQLCDLQ